MPKRTKHLTDEEIIARLEKDAPEVLDAKVNFDVLVGKVLAAGSVDTGRSATRRVKRKAEDRHIPSGR